MLAPRTLKSLLLVPLVLAAGVLAVIAIRDRRPEPEPVRPKDPGPTPVRTVLVRPRDVDLRVEAYGTLLAARRARLASEIGGAVLWVRPEWRTGARVAEGDELLRCPTTNIRPRRPSIRTFLRNLRS